LEKFVQYAEEQAYIPYRPQLSALFCCGWELTNRERRSPIPILISPRRRGEKFSDYSHTNHCCRPRIENTASVRADRDILLLLLFSGPSLGAVKAVKETALLKLADKLIVDLIVDGQRSHGRLALIQKRFDHRDAGPARVGNFGHIAWIVLLSFLDHQRVVDLEPLSHDLP